MIDILMSTFNGEAFLRPQLDSILEQEYTDLRLLIRDDGSTDGTLSIVSEYAEKDPRIVIIRDDAGNVKAYRSFIKLVERSGSPYFMFADQDDVWLPDKTTKMMDRMTQIEAESGTEEPIVVFSDLKIVDEQLSVIDESLWHFQQFDPNICRDWRSLLAQNVVLGCAMLANAKAREISLPCLLPEMYHDQWVAVNAAKYGRIDFIRESTILYRQHSDNHSGANRFGAGYALSRIPNFFRSLISYHNSATIFGDVSAIGLMWRKFWLNVKRFNKRERF
jgi:glycosyltransferase involved in cell wall biosynthesis